MGNKFMRVFVTLFCLFALCDKVFCTNENITSIENNFYDVLDSKPGPWVVVFGRPTCSFTVQFNVIFDAIAERLDEYDCNFGSVNCGDFPNVCKHFGVIKYPDIRYFDKGSKYSYKYTGKFDDYYRFSDFLGGEYVNYKRIMEPSRDTLFVPGSLREA